MEKKLSLYSSIYGTFLFLIHFTEFNPDFNFEEVIVNTKEMLNLKNKIKKKQK